MDELNARSRVYVAGLTGLVGSAIIRRLGSGGFDSVLTGTREQLDVSRLHELGWRHEIELHDGTRSTCDWFLDHRV